MQSHTLNRKPTSENEQIAGTVALKDAIHYRVLVEMYKRSSGFKVCNFEKVIWA